ncbi:MAG TPA: hypothetical protein VGY56_01145, partial [Verrucomicrobiae bacterium]|nr:hypothetical protein [Verrucomicrobiae bacterium]
DRRGARAMGSQPAPLLTLAGCWTFQKSQPQKTKTKQKNHLHKILYKTSLVFAICNQSLSNGLRAASFW